MKKKNRKSFYPITKSSALGQAHATYVGVNYEDQITLYSWLKGKIKQNQLKKQSIKIKHVKGRFFLANACSLLKPSAMCFFREQMLSRLS